MGITYVLNIADGTLPDAQALAALPTGFLKVTTGTGIISSNGNFNVSNAQIHRADLEISPVQEGTYGSASMVASFVVDANGFITSASNIPLVAAPVNLQTAYDATTQATINIDTRGPLTLVGADSDDLFRVAGSSPTAFSVTGAGVVKATALNLKKTSTGATNFSVTDTGVVTAFSLTGWDSQHELSLFSISATGVITGTAFIGPLTGNVTGNLIGNASTATLATTANTAATATLAATVTTNANLTGDVTSVGNETSLPGAWAAFTPTWTSSGTVPALGNGTLTGSYIRLGKTIHARVKLIIGSTTTIGTGIFSFAVPTAAISTFPLKTMIGQAYLENLGVAGFLGLVRMDNVNKVQLETPNTATDTRAADVQAPSGGVNRPIPFATGDFVTFSYTYEIA